MDDIKSDPLTLDTVPADVRVQIVADALRGMSHDDLVQAVKDAHVAGVDTLAAARAADALADQKILQAMADADAQRITDDRDAQLAVKAIHDEQPFVTKTPQGVVLTSGCI